MSWQVDERASSAMPARTASYEAAQRHDQDLLVEWALQNVRSMYAEATAMEIVELGDRDSEAHAVLVFPRSSCGSSMTCAPAGSVRRILSGWHVGKIQTCSRVELPVARRNRRVLRVQGGEREDVSLPSKRPTTRTRNGLRTTTLTSRREEWARRPPQRG